MDVLHNFWHEISPKKTKWAIVNCSQRLSTSEGDSEYSGIGWTLCITSSFRKIRTWIAASTVLSSINQKQQSLKGVRNWSFCNPSRNWHSLAVMSYYIRRTLLVLSDYHLHWTLQNFLNSKNFNSLKICKK